jgi:hypothetical protein
MIDISNKPYQCRWTDDWADDALKRSLCTKFDIYVFYISGNTIHTDVSPFGDSPYINVTVTQRMPLAEQKLLTFDFIIAFYWDSCYSIFYFLCNVFSPFRHCVIYPSNYGFWLSLWYVQPLLNNIITKLNNKLFVISDVSPFGDSPYINVTYIVHNQPQVKPHDDNNNYMTIPDEQRLMTYILNGYEKSPILILTAVDAFLTGRTDFSYPFKMYVISRCSSGIVM